MATSKRQTLNDIGKVVKQVISRPLPPGQPTRADVSIQTAVQGGK